MFRALVSVVLAVVFAAAPAAQRGRIGFPEPAPPLQAPLAQFRSTVEIVHLDVSVLDRDRRPVRGLAPADFTILADGKPQELAVFSAVDIPAPAPPPVAWMRDVAPDVQSNDGLQERRLFLIIIDDAAIEASPFAMKNVGTIARGVIDKLGLSDLAAIVFTRDNRNSQDFTADRARLLTAASKFTVGFRGMGDGPNDLWYSYSVGVVESAVSLFTSLPDRRKSIVYIGQGVPVDFELIATPTAPGLGNGAASALAQQGAMAALKLRMERAFEKAARANVNIYPIDVCGVRVPPGSPPPRPTCVPGLEQDYLRIVASNTGGRAIIDSNTFDSGIDAIFDENSAYYLLGFRPVDTRQDGRVRRLEVRVNRPGVEVRTRSGYDVMKPQDAEKRRAELAAQPLGAALSGVLPKSDLPLQVAAVPFALTGKREAAVAVVVGVRQPIRQSEMRTVEKVDLQVSAFNVEGKAQGATRLVANVAVRAGASGLAEYEVLARIDLKPGRYQLRIAANVGSLQTSGSLYYDIDVPDFSAAPVALSSLLLSAAPAPIGSAQESVKSIVPFLPTARRAFIASDAVTAFTRVYQGGKSAFATVPVQVELRNSQDAVVMQTSQPIDAARFRADRSADVRVDLPMSRLAPGDYLLTIGAGAARRSLRFRVGM